VGYFLPVSATEIINELLKLTQAERRAVFGKLLELEDFPLSEEDEALVDSRLAAHHADPQSSVPLDEMKRRLRSQK
jgi:putative addiction module component (TIGR02574 family)